MLQVPEFEASFGVLNMASYTNVLGRKMRRDFFTPKPVLMQLSSFWTEFSIKIFFDAELNSLSKYIYHITVALFLHLQRFF